MEFSTDVHITGVGTLVAGVNYTVVSGAVINGSGGLTALGYIYGQEWSNVADEINTWTELSVESNIWTEIVPGNNTWQSRG